MTMKGEGALPEDFYKFQKEVLERLAELRLDTRTIKVQLAEERRVLHGNGQPGLVSRITIIENNWRWIKWLSTLAGGGAGFVLSSIISRLLGR